MSSRITVECVTMAGEAIHNLAEPRHFMRVKPVSGRVRILSRAGTLLAQSARAMRLLEVGRDFYDPVIYLPADDVSARLEASGRTTRCPLKGETTYYHLMDDAGSMVAQDLAWSYTTTFEFSEELRGLIAFDPAQAVIEEAPRD